MQKLLSRCRRCRRLGAGRRSRASRWRGCGRSTPGSSSRCHCRRCRSTIGRRRRRWHICCWLRRAHILAVPCTRSPRRPRRGHPWPGSKPDSIRRRHRRNRGFRWLDCDRSTRSPRHRCHCRRHNSFAPSRRRSSRRPRRQRSRMSLRCTGWRRRSNSARRRRRVRRCRQSPDLRFVPSRRSRRCRSRCRSPHSTTARSHRRSRTRCRRPSARTTRWCTPWHLALRLRNRPARRRHTARTSLGSLAPRFVRSRRSPCCCMCHCWRCHSSLARSHRTSTSTSTHRPPRTTCKIGRYCTCCRRRSHLDNKTGRLRRTPCTCLRPGAPRRQPDW